MTTTLETQTCSRCGGSGHYSYCQLYGTKCFKCGGAGKVYTKRGRAARNYLETIRSKPAGELVPGDVVLFPGIPGVSGDRWVTLVSIVPSKLVAAVDGVPVDASNMVDYEGVAKDGKGFSTMGVTKDSLVRVAQTAEQRAETLARAVAFQETLTKTGTPRKVRSKKA